MQNTIFVTGLSPEDTRQIRDDFLAYPFPDWRLEVLRPGAPPPLPLLGGRAVLVVGCGGGPPREHTEVIGFLRLFVCGPWVAVCDDPERVTRDTCELAGAAAYLTTPFSPAKLRELIWYEAVPHVGNTAVLPLTCDKVLRYLAVLRADALLKVTADTGGVGFLAVRGGQLVHARVLDGPDGTTALRRILGWGKGKLIGQPLPTDLKANIPDDPTAIQKLLGPGGRTHLAPFRPVPGGPEACDRVVRELRDVEVCVLADVRSGRVVARPTGTPPEKETDPALVAAATALLTPPDPPTAAAERVEEAVVLGRGGWYAASRIGADALALVVSASGPAHLGLARQVFAAAAAEIEQRSGIVVVDEGKGPRYEPG